MDLTRFTGAVLAAKKEVVTHLTTLNVGGDAKADSFGTVVLAIAILAIDLSLPFTQHGAVHSLVTDLAGKTCLVPCLAPCSHHLSYEHSLVTPGTDICSSPLWFWFGPSRHFVLSFSHHVGGCVLNQGFLRSHHISLGLMIHLIRVGSIAFAIIHGQGPSTTTKTVTLGPEIFPVAGIAEHLVFVFSDRTRVQHFPARTTVKTHFVEDFAQSLHLLCKVDSLVTPWTYSRHFKSLKEG